MDVLCQEIFYKFKLTPEYENYSRKNLLYNDSTEIWKTPDYDGYIKLFAYVVIIIVGFFGNISIISTIAFNKSMRTTVNYYIANLAAADAMICIVCMVPHALTVMTREFFVLGEFMCKFNPFTQMLCLTCSVLTLSTISCDRFMAIIFPLQWRITKQRPSVVMAVIWIISTAVSIPFLIVKRHIVTEWKNFLDPKCTERWPTVAYYDISKGECDFYEPLRSIYYLMVVKMVFTVLIAFIICWTPIQLTILYSALDNIHVPKWFTDFEWFSYYIAYSNSFINPIIYGGYNKAFRDGFCTLLRCGCNGNRFERLARWRSTLSTRLSWISSRNASKKMHDSKKSNVHKMNHELMLMHPVTLDDKFPITKETCVAKA